MGFLVTALVVAAVVLGPRLLNQDGTPKGGTGANLVPMLKEPRVLWSGEGGVPFVPSGDPADARLVALVTQPLKAEGTLSMYDIDQNRKLWSVTLPQGGTCQPGGQPNRIVCKYQSKIAVYEARSGAIVALLNGAGTFGDSVTLMSDDKVAVSHCVDRQRNSQPYPLTCAIRMLMPDGRTVWSTTVTTLQTQWYVGLRVVENLLLISYQANEVGDWRYSVRDAATGNSVEIPDGVRLLGVGKRIIATGDSTVVYDTTGKQIGTLAAEPVLAWSADDGSILGYVSTLNNALQIYDEKGTKTTEVPGERPRTICGGAIITVPVGVPTVRIARNLSGREQWRITLPETGTSSTFCDGTRVIDAAYSQETDTTRATITAYTAQGVSWTHTSHFEGADAVDHRWFSKAGISANARSMSYPNNWKSVILG